MPRSLRRRGVRRPPPQFRKHVCRQWSAVSARRIYIVVQAPSPSIRVPCHAFVSRIILGMEPIGWRMHVSASGTGAPRDLGIERAHLLLRESDEVLVSAAHFDACLAKTRGAF